MFNNLRNYKLKNIGGDTRSESMPGRNVIGNFSVYGGFVFFGFIISAVGFFSSLINIKISQNTDVKRASYAFWCFMPCYFVYYRHTCLYFNGYHIINS